MFSFSLSYLAFGLKIVKCGLHIQTHEGKNSMREDIAKSNVYCKH